MAQLVPDPSARVVSSPPVRAAGRVLLLIGFAFAVMADPVSSVAYTIEASLRALHGHLSQVSGIASAGRETAGREVSAARIETSVRHSRDLVTSDYATPIPSDARNNHQEGKINDVSACR